MLADQNQLDAHLRIPRLDEPFALHFNPAEPNCTARTSGDHPMNFSTVNRAANSLAESS
jgi:hypothetical protein